MRKYIIKRWLIERMSGKRVLIEEHYFDEPEAAFNCMAAYSKLGNFFTIEITP